MRKLFSMMSISLFLIIAAACGSNEANKIDGKGPADIPVKWANAEVQKDQATRANLLAENDGIMSSDKGPENDKTIEKYKLTEWKASDDHYFYEITYQHPIQGKLKTERMEVIKTDSGWKRTEYGDIYNFEKFVEDLEPKVLRELHDK
jgi:hypothetical protein